MIKRAVIGAPARGYVDGRFIGEDKDGADGRRGGRGKTNANADSILGSVNGDGRGAGRGGRGDKRRSAGGGAEPDNIGNTTAKRRGRGAPRGPNATGGGQGQGRGQGRGQGSGQARGQGQGQGQGQGLGQGQGQPRGQGQRRGAGQGQGQAQAPRGRGGKPRANSGQGTIDMLAPPSPGPRARGPGQGAIAGRPAARKPRGAKKTPFRAAPQLEMSPSQGADLRRMGDEAKSGQFAEALAASANIKRERLHKILAQSGHGSRRDMEILISSGRVMVNGIVATTGTQVAPGDNVLLDHRPIKLKFNEDLPRVLLYHKPEGEIVTTDDPGNRITVFDNLPRVETGKWVAVGRLDINTSGLLIFTTSGELANRFMHPRYEVEREYAVRILGELTEEQTQRLLDGVNIDGDGAQPEADHEAEDEFEFAAEEFGDGDDESIVPRDIAPVFQRSGLAKFDVIEKRGGEGVNHWYHVVIKEGRNREVRKMFESLGLQVSRLIRTRFGKVELPPRLMRGKMLELDPSQVKSVLVSAGMKVEGGAAPLPSRDGRDNRENREGREPREGRETRGPSKTRGPRARGAPREARPPREANHERGNQADGNAGADHRAPDGAPFVVNDGTAPVNKRNRRNKRGARGRDANGDNSRADNRGAGNRNVASNSADAASTQFSADAAGAGIGAAPTAAAPADANAGRGERDNKDKGGRGRSRRNLRGRSRSGPPRAGGADAGGNGDGGGNNGGNSGSNRDSNDRGNRGGDNVGNSVGNNAGNRSSDGGGNDNGGNSNNGGGEGFGNV